MKFKEENVDIFEAPEDFYFAHCISRDAAMGAGIAKEFVKRFPELKVLREGRKSYGIEGGCKQVGRVFNLVTKEKYYEKPTYDSMRTSLRMLRDMVVFNGVEKIAMPRIGSGLDRLQWSKVREMIKEEFKDVDVLIVVCYI